LDDIAKATQTSGKSAEALYSALQNATAE
jgi:hypothetical protein